jgi:putative holliday junction resolvase
MTEQIILGLDVGDKRVGVAMSRSLSGPVFALPTLLRAQGNAEQEILSLIEKHKATTLVVGLPLGENGEATKQSDKVRSFCRRLERRAAVNIVFVDEYLSSAEALEELNLNRADEIEARRKGLIDAAAACRILEAYLTGRAAKLDV